MFVVVEDLVVVAALASVALYEDRTGRVDHDLPHVVVLEQRFQRAVAGEVSVGPADHGGRVRQVEIVDAPLVVDRPLSDLVLDQGSQPDRSVVSCHVQGHGLRPFQHRPLDIGQRRLAHELAAS